MTGVTLPFSGTLSEKGCLLIASAVDPRTVDAYVKGLETADPKLLTLVDHSVGVTSFNAARLRIPLNRLTDTHWPVAAGRDMLASVSLINALQSGLDSTQVLCFETFHLEVGLGMRFHRESWYVPLRDHPARLLTAWIALEDIGPESGELLYVPGSHLYEGFDDPSLAAPAKHEQFVVRFGDECRARGVKAFAARKGDALITSGDLAVGGAPVPSPVPNCRILSAHFCALRDDPGYFRHLEPEYRVKRQLTRELYASTAYPGRY